MQAQLVYPHFMKTMRYAGRTIVTIAFTLGALHCATCVGQDIPKGVTHKKATDEVNRTAKAALEQALSAKAIPSNFLRGTISCGPILWSDLKTEQDSLSKDSTPVTMFLSIPDAVQAEGRGFRTQVQRDKFWKLVVEKIPDLRKAVVRPARTSEIQFYWTTIPFDIEEPFFAIETDRNVFVANLRIEGDTPVLFWLDRIDDLGKLRKH